MKTLKTLWVLFCISLVIFLVVLFVRGCNKRVAEWDAASAARIAKQEAFRATLPHAGERVRTKDFECVVLKEYFWSTSYKFQVRLEDGTITDIIHTEVIEIIGRKKDNL